MPPKEKKKRASLKLDATTGQIKEAEVSEPTARQVVEVVEDNQVPEAIETIKKDAAEIEEVIETIEEKIEEAPKPEAMNEEVSEDAKGSVESLFAKATSSLVQPEITVVGKRDKSIGVWVGAMLGVVLAVGVSLVLLVRGPSRISWFAPKPTPTPTQAPQPTPIPLSNVNRKDVKVSVINGGGVAGAGSKMKALLESKGYVVTNVGNADEYTFDQTEIHVKSGQDTLANLLKVDLKTEYTLSSSTSAVTASAAYDAQIIVGKE